MQKYRLNNQESAPADVTSEPAGQVLQLLRMTPAAKRRQVLIEQIDAMVQHIHQAERTQPLQAAQKIFELGLPSLMLIELKHRLEQAFTAELPVTLFFEHVTLEMLATHLLTEVLQLTPDRPEHEAGPAPPADDESKAVEELAQLSDEEVEARLLERIAELEGRLDP
ncbi:MAG: phosphopantetheine-binding protein [Candidatus Tectomicrobia bacterium]|nr:phosphopantetheine-binding protein [Candidatus Tectomicrobia bacterium]